MRTFATMYAANPNLHPLLIFGPLTDYYMTCAVGLIRYRMGVESAATTPPA